LGAKQSFRINTTIVVIKLAVIVGFIAIGLMHFDPANWTPFVPPNAGSWGTFGVSGIVKGAAVVFVAYLGFDVLATTAQEARNPSRTVPRAIILTLLLCTALYVMASLALTGMARYTDLDVGNPLDVALRANATARHWMVIVVDVGITIGLTAGVFSLLYAQARVMYAMATDDLLPGGLATISSRGVPVSGIVVAGLLTAALAGTLPVAFLSELIAAGTLLVFALVCVTLLILRRTAPQARRAFVVPLVPWVPVTGCLACCGLLAGLSSETWIRFGAWLAAGLAIYALRATCGHHARD
jgi:APA family basic amino acid/polyamine antiporter